MPGKPLTHYQRLAEVGTGLSPAQNPREVRPVYHGRAATRARNPIGIFFLAYWLTVRLQTQ
ncbi:hypothetical protein [Candidatus Methylacidithermus pantelleriae]|uniref:hypothetical protein n=1 Tax=Candidatus Methylacidithermus pantelleriae TaxID=2744239 RepID=UPI001BD4E3F2|nr:hypothetical protein [Candidatus Methylacidithermus pantelleriae]